MKLAKYKLLTTLYLIKQYSGLINSPRLPAEEKPDGLRASTRRVGESAGFLRELMGPSYRQIISRLVSQKLISVPRDTLRVHSTWNSPSGWKPFRHAACPVVHKTAREGRDTEASRDYGLQITYRGENDLLMRFPNLNFVKLEVGNEKLDNEIRSGNLDQTSNLSLQNPTSHIPLPTSSKWNQKFTLVSFNIPEEKREVRDRLRYILGSLFFGRISRSLYISPYVSPREVSHIVQSLQGLILKGLKPVTTGLDEASVFVFSVSLEDLTSAEGKPDGLRASTRRVEESAREVLPRFWDLTKVADLYERALAFWETSAVGGNSKFEIRNLQSSSNVSKDSGRGSSSLSLGVDDQNDVILGSGATPGSVFNIENSLKIENWKLKIPAPVAGKFLSKFLEAFLLDPFLPAPILPNNWPGTPAMRIARDVMAGQFEI